MNTMCINFIINNNNFITSGTGIGEEILPPLSNENPIGRFLSNKG